MTKLSTLTLEKLDALGAFQNEPRTLRVEKDQVTLTCHLESADALSCAFTELRLTAAPCDSAVCEQRAEQICRTLTYLLEPLELIETDPGSGRALLRSNPPQAEETARTYYEVLVDPAGLVTVQRFRRTREPEPRASIACRLTKEALARMIDDLVETMS